MSVESMAGEVAQALVGHAGAVGGACVCIGNFDGVHLGHQALLAFARQKAEGRPVVAMTFDPHPVEVLRGLPLSRLTSIADREALLRTAGADHVVVLPFDRHLAALSAEAFAHQILHEALRARTLVVGYDFSFGRDRTGTFERLQQLGKHYGFETHRLEAIMADGRAVSSTRVREELEQGRTQEAAALLGRCHAVRSVIVHGQKRGGTLLGFPTANLPPLDELLPKAGVYATLAMLPAPGENALPPIALHTRPVDNLRVFGAVTNIGVNPTFALGHLSVETHLFGLARDLYGQPLEVAFVERLRGEQRFNGPAELTAQIARDIAEAQNVLKRLNFLEKK